ncbi:MAG: hypothetical protein PHC61_13595 [Chitinivibrionales bacterium]|nr:hypothetical protein [Chitinivibrionales bacterium]
MGELREELILKAQEIYQQIFPCSSKSSLEECFTVMGKKYLFWFNTADASTHVLMAELVDME